MNEVNCSLCGQFTAYEIRRNKIIGKGEKIVVAENVPMISCRNCGHDYFSIEVARKLDAIRLNPQSFAIHKSVAVYEFE